MTAQQRETQEKLRQFQALCDASAQIVFDLQGNILDANDNFLKAMGYEADEIIGKHHSIFVHPEYAGTQRHKDFWNGITTGEFQTGVFRRFRKDGEKLWLQATYTPVFNAAGEATKVIKLASDVTQREEANDLSTMVSRVQAVIEFDVDGNIKHANDLFLNAMGYTLDEIKGKHHSIFMPEGEAGKQEYKDHWADLRSGEFKADNFRRRHKNGSDVWISAAYNPVLDAMGNPVKVIKYATDITARITAVAKLREGLEKLAKGDLSAPIEDSFSEDFEPLRTDYNTAVSKLQSSLETVVASAAQISDGTAEITSASQDLSARTEHQAAALDKTSSAIKEMAASVKSTAETTHETQTVVEKTKSHAASGSDIMQKARGAMGAIAESSDQISEITTMIEDIAFQTNLLALNAGVEAARAGDAGRGFAVVASEVRALALRSSEAATQISQLISTSTQQVEEGVDLVSKTNEALEQIGSFVEQTVGMVSKIAQDATLQADGIGNITHALGQLEDVTQKNAAMFEETNAATKLLANQSEVLKKTTSSFLLSKGIADAPALKYAS